MADCTGWVLSRSTLQDFGGIEILSEISLEVSLGPAGGSMTPNPLRTRMEASSPQRWEEAVFW